MGQARDILHHNRSKSPSKNEEAVLLPLLYLKFTLMYRGKAAVFDLGEGLFFAHALLFLSNDQIPEAGNFVPEARDEKGEAPNQNPEAPNEKGEARNLVRGFRKQKGEARNHKEGSSETFFGSSNFGSGSPARNWEGVKKVGSRGMASHAPTSYFFYAFPE